MKIRTVFWLLLIFPRTASPGETPRLKFQAVAPEIIQGRLESVPKKVADRRAKLVSLFEESGCRGAQLSEQAVAHSKESNLICTLPGETMDTIVVGGHFDDVNRGMGAVDDWSGVALLPSLYQSLAIKPRHHRIVLIAFAGEERGLLGSTQYVRSLGTNEKAQVRAMINLECLGLSPPKVWGSRADPLLMSIYTKVASAMHQQPSSVNVDQAGDDDSHPFLNAHIPVLTIHSLTQETLKILHSPQDQVSAIEADDYYEAYRLAAAYLATADETLK